VGTDVCCLLSAVFSPQSSVFRTNAGFTVGSPYLGMYLGYPPVSVAIRNPFQFAGRSGSQSKNPTGMMQVNSSNK